MGLSNLLRSRVCSAMNPAAPAGDTIYQLAMDTTFDLVSKRAWQTGKSSGGSLQICPQNSWARNCANPPPPLPFLKPVHAGRGVDVMGQDAAIVSSGTGNSGAPTRCGHSRTGRQGGGDASQVRPGAAALGKPTRSTVLHKNWHPTPTIGTPAPPLVFNPPPPPQAPHTPP